MSCSDNGGVKMAEKILIASGKGGVGKSTVTVFLGKAAAENGQKVLLIDSDTGLGALDIMLSVSDKKMNTWLDVSLENCELRNAVISISDKLHLLPSPAVYPESIDDDVFVNIVSECENDYDIIFIDASAGIDENLKRAAKCCDRAIFIATADAISVKGAAAAATETEKFGIEREDMRLIINRFVKKAAMKSKLLNVDGVIDKSGVRLLGILPEDKKIPFSSVTSVLPDKKSRFAKAVKRISGRIQGKNIPLALNELK